MKEHQQLNNTQSRANNTTQKLNDKRIEKKNNWRATFYRFLSRRRRDLKKNTKTRSKLCQNTRKTKLIKRTKNQNNISRTSRSKTIRRHKLVFSRLKRSIKLLAVGIRTQNPQKHDSFKKSILDQNISNFPSQEYSKTFLNQHQQHDNKIQQKQLVRCFACKNRVYQFQYIADVFEYCKACCALIREDPDYLIFWARGELIDETMFERYFDTIKQLVILFLAAADQIKNIQDYAIVFQPAIPPENMMNIPEAIPVIDQPEEDMRQEVAKDYVIPAVIPVIPFDHMFSSTDSGEPSPEQISQDYPIWDFALSESYHTDPEVIQLIDRENRLQLQVAYEPQPAVPSNNLRQSLQPQTNLQNQQKYSQVGINHPSQSPQSFDWRSSSLTPLIWHGRQGNAQLEFLEFVDALSVGRRSNLQQSISYEETQSQMDVIEENQQEQQSEDKSQFQRNLSGQIDIDESPH